MLAVLSIDRPPKNLNSTISALSGARLRERFQGIVQCQQIRASTAWQPDRSMSSLVFPDKKTTCRPTFPCCALFTFESDVRYQ